MDMGAVSGCSGGLDIDPDKPFFAEANNPRRADVSTKHHVCSRLGHLLKQPAGSERSHVLLIARQGNYDLPRPGISLIRECASGEQGRGNATLHVRDTTPVKASIPKISTQRRY